MNNPFRRMVLIPEEELKIYKRHIIYAKQEESKNPEIAMHQKLKEVVDRDLPDDIRLKLEGDIISKYTKPSSKDPPSSITDKIKESSRYSALERSLDQFPKQYRTRAKQLYHHLVSNLEELQWNERGELLNESHEVIPRSNIIDMLTYAVGHKTSLKTPPAGYALFNQIMKQTNVPRVLLGPQGKELINVDETNPIGDIHWQTMQ